MADVKISGLPASTTPLAGTEVLPIVQNGATKKVAVSNLTAGRAVSALSYESSAGANIATSSGHLGVGAYPSSWHTSVVKAIEIARPGNAVYAQTNNNTINVTSNAYFDNAGWKYGTTATASYYSQYDGEHSWWNAPSGTADTAINFTQRMVLNPTNGNLTLNTGNLVINTSGKGIDFSATPGTGTSELLADYEEGTWTPAGNGVTYTTATGKYTKVGNLVTCTFQIIFPTTANGSNAQVLGLPFLANSNSAVALAKYTSGINCQLATGNSLLQFSNLTNTAFITNVTLSTQSINGVISYQV